MYSATYSDPGITAASEDEAGAATEEELLSTESGAEEQPAMSKMPISRAIVFFSIIKSTISPRTDNKKTLFRAAKSDNHNSIAQIQPNGVNNL